MTQTLQVIHRFIEVPSQESDDPLGTCWPLIHQSPKIVMLYLERRNVRERHAVCERGRRQMIAISRMALLGPRVPIWPMPRTTTEASPSTTTYRQKPGSSW